MLCIRPTVCLEVCTDRCSSRRDLRSLHLRRGSFSGANVVVICKFGLVSGRLGVAGFYGFLPLLGPTLLLMMQVRCCRWRLVACNHSNDPSSWHLGL